MNKESAFTRRAASRVCVSERLVRGGASRGTRTKTQGFLDTPAGAITRQQEHIHASGANGTGKQRSKGRREGAFRAPMPGPSCSSGSRADVSSSAQTPLHPRREGAGQDGGKPPPASPTLDDSEAAPTQQTRVHRSFRGSASKGIHRWSPANAAARRRMAERALGAGQPQTRHRAGAGERGRPRPLTGGFRQPRACPPAALNPLRLAGHHRDAQ